MSAPTFTVALSPRQRQLLDEAKRYRHAKGSWPTRRKFAAWLKVDDSGYLQRVLKVLRDNGHFASAGDVN